MRMFPSAALRAELMLCCLLAVTACGGGGSGGSSSSNASATPPSGGGSTDTQTPADPLAWEEATPASVGLLESQLDAAAEIALADGSFGQAFVVIKDGKLVFERYRGITDGEKAALGLASGLSDAVIDGQYGLRDRNSLTTSWSVAKSFTSALIGVAIDQGLIGSVDDRASFYIDEWANDPRANITLRDLLDMRSGLVPMCWNAASQQIEECGIGVGNGGNIVYADDQMSACIDRPLAAPGDSYLWYQGGAQPYPAGAWVYSNCDTMVLGEILFRVTGERMQAYADEHLFAKLGMTAHWWRDNSGTGQIDGNYLAYCCIDATPRDFARFGQMLLESGAFAGQQVVSVAYIDAIKAALLDDTGFYNYQFWATPPAPVEGGTAIFPTRGSMISGLGFDNQSITIDPANALVVVRMGLYAPLLSHSDDRIMRLRIDAPEATNWVGSLPQGRGINSAAPFALGQMLYAIHQAM